MVLNDIIFEKTNGGMGRPAANEDIISGLIMALDGDLAGRFFEQEEDETQDKVFETIGEGNDLLYVARLNYYEQLSMKYGIKAKELTEEEKEDGEILELPDFARNTIDYHVREFFRMSPTGILYLAIRLTDEVIDEDIKGLQYYAGGLLRQVGILTKTITEGECEKYQTACNKLFNEHQPLSVIVAYGGADVDDKPIVKLNDLTGTNSLVDDFSNISVLVSCDLNPELKERLGNFFYYGCIGTALGAISKAAVHECIAWVQKFPLKLKEPGFISGELLKNVPMGELENINGNRYIFVRTHVGNANNYFNDSHTLDALTSDYAYIENMRTMDKATRGIRKNLLPYLNAPLYVDSSGNLRPDMVAFLETTAGRALEDMEKDGELSGYSVSIDPTDILRTSELKVLIKKLPVGVMRMVRIKIGYTTSL